MHIMYMFYGLRHRQCLCVCVCVSMCDVSVCVSVRVSVRVYVRAEEEDTCISCVCLCVSGYLFWSECVRLQTTIKNKRSVNRSFQKMCQINK